LQERQHRVQEEQFFLDLYFVTFVQEVFWFAMDVYDGNADTYIVYNVAAEKPGGFADDNPAVNEMYFQVHLFVPLNKNYLNMQSKG